MWNWMNPCEHALDLWLGITSGLPVENVFRYDTVWGGMYMRSAGLNEPIFPWTNFGFVSYADHHFHIGYWIYAIAYYAKYYPEWANKEDNRIRITSLARDIGNPSKKDVYFPTVRQKDWYFGSSGLLGSVEAQGKKNQLVRAYKEVRLLGQLQEDGIFYYMINWECDPDQFPQRHACLVGIQLIPIMSISHWYVDQEWANNVYNICSWAIDPSSAPGGDMIDQIWDTSEPVSTKWGLSVKHYVQENETSQTDAVEYTVNLDTSDLEPGSGLASNLLFIYESS
ncbi:hypothetical protein BSL78_02844 [Apostichopus japonicus]|uniref:glucan endo-1,3-beta-D-glucosidase n=1 Tax=Stichopus japonicus TaxID=307972 RepID=A0A2G8LIY1_STIJA|nr:hypothetical protein BSL78_02844 [Apostichopus japonicus]